MQLCASMSVPLPCCAIARNFRRWTDARQADLIRPLNAVQQCSFACQRDPLASLSILSSCFAAFAYAVAHAKAFGEAI